MPGSHLPHAWVGDNTHKLAMMDLAPYDRFTLITGIAGEAWEDAADDGRPASSASRCEPSSSARAARSPTSTTTGPKLREVEEGGALLVRPDKHIAWRSHVAARRPDGRAARRPRPRCWGA